MHLLLTSADGSVRKRLRRELEAHGHRVDLARDGVEAWHRLRSAPPQVLVTELELQHMGGLELTRTLRRNPATRELPVLLLKAPGGASPQELTSGRDAADEVMLVTGAPDPGVLEARLVSLLERLAGGRSTEAPATGRTIAVTSAKGGAGVSSVAANLALALSASGDRSVVAVDLDLQYGDLPMLLDVRHATGIDELAAALALDGEEVAPEDHLARHPSGLRVLASPQTPVDALHMDEAATEHVLTRLRGLHDVLVVDVPPGFGDPALVALTRADRVVIIVVPEVTALVRTLRLLGVLRSLEVPDERLVLVFNRTVDSPHLPRERAEAALERPILVDVPHDLALFHRATTTGRPVVDLEPDHEVSRQLRRLAEMLTP